MENIYNDEPYRKEITSKVDAIFIENGENYLRISENIYYPQGGGQKGDRGQVKIGEEIYNVNNAIKDKKDKFSDSARLLVDKPVSNDLIGKTADCNLDWDFRYAQMRLHTLVHLHHYVMEKVLGGKLSYPETSDIQDGFAFNRYDDIEITPVLVEKANVELQKLIQLGETVKTYPHPIKKGYRIWECFGYTIPCGGTHVANINEIGDVNITTKTKKRKMTINFNLKR